MSWQQLWGRGWCFRRGAHQEKIGADLDLAYQELGAKLGLQLADKEGPLGS